MKKTIKKEKTHTLFFNIILSVETKYNTIFLYDTYTYDAYSYDIN